MKGYKYEQFVQKERRASAPIEEFIDEPANENDYVPMSAHSSSDEKEIPYNDEVKENSTSGSGSKKSLKSFMTGFTNKKPKSHKSAQSSLASEESSVPPPREGFVKAPSAQSVDSEDSSVPSGKSGFFEPEDKSKRGTSKSVNMAGDVEKNVKDTASVASEETVDTVIWGWFNTRIALILGVVMFILFLIMFVAVGLAIDNKANPPTRSPTISPSRTPTTMPSRAPTQEPTVEPRPEIPSYSVYYNDFRISLQANEPRGYLSTLEGTSPQVQAFRWITRSGSSCCSYPNLSLEFLFERYVVTTILFGTQDGYPWPDNWREEWKEVSVCDWASPTGIGVFCDSGGFIRELTLRNLYVGDEFPPEVGLLNNLQILSLASWDGIGFTIPMEVGRLNNLEFLKISSTGNLKGTIPTEVGQLTKLTILSLRDNHLDGTLPSEVGNLSILQTLQLDNNSFTGILPDDIGRLGTLQHLVLSHNKFDSNIPNEVNQLTTLEELRLDENQFSGSIPNNFQALTGLRWLNLESNVDDNGNVLLEGNLNPLCDAGGGQLLLNFKADCNNDKITCYCCFCFG